jgi:ankyrin repeat protein
LKSVELMLDAGFDIEARADDLVATGLHYAASNGDLEMTRLLLSRGARLDVKHKYGSMPLGTAIYCAAHFRNPQGRYAEVVGMLLDGGAETEPSSLAFAVENELDDIANVLKMRGLAL